MENRVIEFVDHLHEHFVDPVVIRRGQYMPPTRGYSTEILPKSREEYDFRGCSVGCGVVRGSEATEGILRATAA